MDTTPKHSLIVFFTQYVHMVIWLTKNPTLYSILLSNMIVLSLTPCHWLLTLMPSLFLKAASQTKIWIAFVSECLHKSREPSHTSHGKGIYCSYSIDSWEQIHKNVLFWGIMPSSDLAKILALTIYWIKVYY